MPTKTWAARKAAKQRRMMEIEDGLNELSAKCAKLAEWIKSARCTVVYTGAGISTAASIPDYRGPSGVWTLAEQGKTHELMDRCVDPVSAEPTASHMALVELHRRGYVRHLVSQNCDGLHLRSGLPQQVLSEIHGNMYIEACSSCEPLRQYIRPYDVTGRTGFRRHDTGRRCDRCGGQLKDTIVHFGEVGRLAWPLNWNGIETILSEDCCDLVIVLGSSLKVMGKYKFLWPTANQRKKQKVAIVNLQWTCKDRIADLKINGRCDEVMRRVLELLNLDIPPYCRACDRVLDTRRRVSHNNRLMTQLGQCQCVKNSTKISRRVNRAVDNGINGCMSASEWPALQTAHQSSIEGAEPDGRSRSMPGWWTAGFQAQANKRVQRQRSSTMAARRARASVSADRPYTNKEADGKRPAKRKRRTRRQNVSPASNATKIRSVGKRPKLSSQIDAQVFQCVQDLLTAVCAH